MTRSPSIPPTGGTGRSTSLGANDPRARREGAPQVQPTRVRPDAVEKLRGETLSDSATLAEVITAYNRLLEAVTEGR